MNEILLFVFYAFWTWFEMNFLFKNSLLVTLKDDVDKSSLFHILIVPMRFFLLFSLLFMINNVQFSISSSTISLICEICMKNFKMFNLNSIFTFLTRLRLIFHEKICLIAHENSWCPSYFTQYAYTILIFIIIQSHYTFERKQAWDEI